MKGQLHKMRSRLDSPVQYELAINDEHIPLNAFIGKSVSIDHSGRIECLHCKKITKKSYNQGYCYRCFITLAQCDLCILKPETCHYAAGTCREPEWGLAFCFQPHVVYLANSSDLKVGITRQSQIPTRWIDQGAMQALPIFKTESRHIAGLIEVILARHINDKTHWQKMLKSPASPIDLLAKRDELLAVCHHELATLCEHYGQQAFTLANDAVVNIDFPVVSYPEKIKSLCLTKTPVINGVLQGIKGQYLLLDNGVLNVRKYSGYEVEFRLAE